VASASSLCVRCHGLEADATYSAEIFCEENTPLIRWSKNSRDVG